MESYGLDSSTSSSIREESSENTSSHAEAGTQLQGTVNNSVHEESKLVNTSVQWRPDSFQKEIDKWKEFYDDMKTYLSDGTLPLRSQTNILKQAEAYSLGPNNRLYYTKTLRDSPGTLKLPVVRSYEERMQVCKAIHLNTGEENIHYRRDTMLELLGQQYYWKGQRRDVCQCIASCEMCSLGLGAKRRAKPPSQKRDIRPPQKLLRVGSSLLPFTSISTTTNPPAVPHFTPPFTSIGTTTNPPAVPHSTPPLPSISTTTNPPAVPHSTTPFTSISTTTNPPAVPHSTPPFTSISTTTNPPAVPYSTPPSTSISTTTNPPTVPHSTPPFTSINTTTNPPAVPHSTPPLPSISTTTNPPAVPHSTPQENHKEESSSSSATNNATLISPSHLFTDSTVGTVHHLSAFIPSTSNSAFRPVIPNADHTTSSSAPVDPLTNLYTIANACVSTDARLDDTTLGGKESHTNTEMSIGSEVMISDSSGLQIFMTINEPCEPDERDNNDCHTILSACDENSEATSGSSDEDDDQYVVQLSSPAHDITSSEPSIYQLLFQLPSVPNTSLCGAVIESMQMSLKSTADPAQLAHVSSQSLLSALKLPTSPLVALVSPSRATAYIISLAAVLTKQHLLSINSQITQTNPVPPVILHDTCCEVGSPKMCSSLVGACNWNVGTHTNPMDQDMLQMVLSSNRVVAIFHRPYIYPRNSGFLPLDTLSSISRGVNSDIGLIVDCAGMTGNSLANLTSTLQEIITKGADLIMLPNTDYFQGPPHTCVLVGRAALLGGMWDQVSLLQRQLGLPLLCSAYDTVGSVVAFKSLQVSGIKEEPSY